jgi:hypothetical protein
MAEWATRNKTDILSGVKSPILRSKFLKRNTVEYFTDRGQRIVRLHDTDIVTFPNPDNPYWFILNSGGWRTPTTKDRINAVLPQGVCIYQDRGIWYVRIGLWDSNSGKTIPFFDGIEIRDGILKNPKDRPVDDESEQQRLRALIRKYTAKVARQWDEAPMQPRAGDCFICTAHSGRITKSSRHPTYDCLVSHLEEGYVHGTLVYNAIKWAGYEDRQMPYVFGMKSIAVRAVRRFLKAQLGMEAR